MKNITISLFTILYIMISYSCVKEQDITTMTTTTTEPETGETNDLSGLVRDTLGQAIPNVNVKLYLDDLELETETDANGEYNFIIPTVQDEGYVVVDDIKHQKNIQYFNETQENDLETLFLIEEEIEENIDLSLKLDSVVIVRGQFIDLNGEPLEDVIIFFASILLNDEFEYVNNGFAKTDKNGNFEFVFEDVGYLYSIFSAIYPSVCAEYISSNFNEYDSIIDMGVITMDIGDLTQFESSVSDGGYDCYENTSLQSYNYDNITNNVYDQPLGNFSISYCAEGNEVFYVGVVNQDKTDFDGQFVAIDKVESEYATEICTPMSEEFLEIKIGNNEEILTTDDLQFIDDFVDLIIFDNGGNTIILYVKSISKFVDDENNTLLQSGQMDYISIIENGVEQSVPFLNKNYINFVQDDANIMSGVIQGKVQFLDGTIEDIKIRFRVQK